MLRNLGFKTIYFENESFFYVLFTYLATFNFALVFVQTKVNITHTLLLSMVDNENRGSRGRKTILIAFIISETPKTGRFKDN